MITLTLAEFREILGEAVKECYWEADRKTILALGPGRYAFGACEQAGHECPVYAAGFNFCNRCPMGVFSAALKFDELISGRLTVAGLVGLVEVTP